MLKAKAKIKFTLEGKNYANDSEFRIAFRFADNLIFSGHVISDNEIYFANTEYDVRIQFFTVEDEAYNALTPILSTNDILAMCAGKRILGTAKLIDYSFIE
ncbi:MAG: hypothetical protein FWG68_03940 [Defluviitaleaceae bacterium]|nr:hypothetical protein [Defluviitaleaceae bacterium]